MNVANPSRIGIRISVRGRAATLNFADLGPKEARLVREATGFALRELLDAERFDLDSLCIIWWLARRRAGEHLLTYEMAEDGFPSYTETDSLDIEAIEEEPEDDGSPEASGGPSETTGPPSPTTSASSPGMSNA